MANLRGPGSSMVHPVEDEPIDLNTADRDQLMAVRGVGEGRADQIIAWREQHGRFEAVEDLQHLPDIGPEGMRELRPHFKV